MACVFLRRICPAVFAFLFVLLTSCIGVSSQIKLNSDGSGTMVLEYRISLELDDFGRLDENEMHLPVPTAREDIERSIVRVPGLSLVSFTLGQDGKDMVYRAEIAFASPEALETFLGGEDQQFKIDFPGRRITLLISRGEDKETDDSFRDLFAGALEGYVFSFSFVVPGMAKISWFDGNGRTTQQFPGTCSAKDAKADYTVSMKDILYLNAPLTLEISW
ncbi:MAG: hypothetical protein FWG27_03730 [Treponema sp.]|nr:hypothetical protein [Treponema sp.]